MSFDEWLLNVKKMTWEQYLGLPDDIQDKLSDEYESSEWNKSES